MFHHLALEPCKFKASRERPHSSVSSIYPRVPSSELPAGVEHRSSGFSAVFSHMQHSLYNVNVLHRLVHAHKPNEGTKIVPINLGPGSEVDAARWLDKI